MMLFVQQDHEVLRLILNPAMMIAVGSAIAVIIGAIAAAVVVVFKGIRDAKHELKRDIAVNTELTAVAKSEASKAAVVAVDWRAETERALNGRLSQLLTMTAEAEYAKGLANGVHAAIAKQVAINTEAIGNNEQGHKDIANTLGKILSRLDIIDERQKVADERITRHNENNKKQIEMLESQLGAING